MGMLCEGERTVLEFLPSIETHTIPSNESQKALVIVTQVSKLNYNKLAEYCILDSCHLHWQNSRNFIVMVIVSSV